MRYKDCSQAQAFHVQETSELPNRNRTRVSRLPVLLFYH